MSEIIPHPNAAEYDLNTQEYRDALHRFMMDQCSVNYSLATDMIHLLQRLSAVEKNLAFERTRTATLEAQVKAMRGNCD